MKAYDYDAVAHDGEIYCVGCQPKEVLLKDCDPIFADSEWDHYPVCGHCGYVHEYVNLTIYGHENKSR